jgi:hypothetical protein
MLGRPLELGVLGFGLVTTGRPVSDCFNRAKKSCQAIFAFAESPDSLRGRVPDVLAAPNRPVHRHAAAVQRLRMPGYIAVGRT